MGVVPGFGLRRKIICVCEKVLIMDVVGFGFGGRFGFNFYTDFVVFLVGVPSSSPDPQPSKKKGGGGLGGEI